MPLPRTTMHASWLLVVVVVSVMCLCSFVGCVTSACVRACLRACMRVFVFVCVAGGERDPRCGLCPCEAAAVSSLAPPPPNAVSGVPSQRLPVRQETAAGPGLRWGQGPVRKLPRGPHRSAQTPLLVAHGASTSRERTHTCERTHACAHAPSSHHLVLTARPSLHPQHAVPA